MHRLIWVLCGAVLFAIPQTMMAQHRGGRGGGTGAARGPAGVSDKDDLKDFKRAIALQATPDQVQQFRQLSESVQSARKEAQSLLQIAQNAGGRDSWQHDLNQHADPLSDAVDEAQTTNGKFLNSFSSAQKSGLKNETKKLAKTNSEITRQNNALARELGHTGIDGRLVASVAEKLEKVLSDFETGEHAMGSEMGISDEKPASDASKDQHANTDPPRLVVSDRQ